VTARTCKSATLTSARRRHAAGYYIWKFKDLLITKFEIACSDDIVEKIALRLTAIYCEYKPQKPDGSLDSALKGGWTSRSTRSGAAVEPSECRRQCPVDRVLPAHGQRSFGTRRTIHCTEEDGVPCRLISTWKSSQEGGNQGETLSQVCPEQIEGDEIYRRPRFTDGLGVRPPDGVQLEHVEIEFPAASPPPAFQTLCTNDVIKTATLTCRKAGGSGKEHTYLQWRFRTRA